MTQVTADDGVAAGRAHALLTWACLSEWQTGSQTAGRAASHVTTGLMASLISTQGAAELLLEHLLTHRLDAPPIIISPLSATTITRHSRNRIVPLRSDLDRDTSDIQDDRHPILRRVIHPVTKTPCRFG